MLRLALCALLIAGPALRAAGIPVIHCTDLFHPPQDPDDHYDLATLFALPGLDIRAVILDQGSMQRQGPGSIPLRQMMHITGQTVPWVSGLETPLRYPEDKGLNQFTHDGPETILRVLRVSREKVRIITTGSVRDVAAAFNRDEALFRSKVDRIYINAGNSGGGDLQWNPRLDPQAYLRLMRSDLPIYWAPCFGGKETLAVLAQRKLPVLPNQTFWEFRQSDLLSVLSNPLKNFFLYALSHADPAADDPIAALDRVPDAALERKFGSEYRNMWSTVTLLDAANLRVYRRGSSWFAAQARQPGDEEAQMFEFVPVRIRIDADLRGFIEGPDPSSTMRVFHIQNTGHYQEAMLSILRHLLAPTS
jgi:hypothetical protein